MEMECLIDVVDEQQVRTDNDNAWKSILHAHFKDFMEFFWSKAYEAIDWDKPYQALEQELLEVGLKGDIGKRYIDKLFQVYLKDGTQQWILIHIEIQHKKDEEFPKRQFVYFYRIFDFYDKDIASMAVLADKHPTWEPKQYYRSIWGSSISRTYETVKLINFKSKKEELLESQNPFAMVVLIQLDAHETTPNDEARILTKLEFFKALHKKGWSNETIRNMYRFLDIMLCLKDDFEIEYEIAAKKIDEGQKMQIMSNIERKAYLEGEQRGEQRGEQGGEAKILTNLLILKFKTIPVLYLNKIENAGTVELEKWALNIFAARTIEEVFL